MTKKPVICLHTDSSGDIWSLQSGKDIVRPKFDTLPTADYWVVGFPANYWVLTELYFETVRRYKVNNLDLSNVYVGSTLPWQPTVAESKFFLYDLAVVPACKRQSFQWHLLDGNSINTYLLARGMYDNVPEVVDVAWQDHCLAPVFSSLGCDLHLDPAMHFVATLVDPRWYIPPSGSLKNIERFFGLKSISCELTAGRFNLLSDVLKALPSDSFLHVETKARKGKDKFFELARLFLHFIVRHWLSFQTRLGFFDSNLFFKSDKAKKMYLSAFGSK